MVKKRNPLRLTRAEEEMILAIRECRRLKWSYEHSSDATDRGYFVTDCGGFYYYGHTLPAALKKAKGAMR